MQSGGDTRLSLTSASGERGSRDASLQASAVELAGLEPATSWVRCGTAIVREMRRFLL